MKYFSRFFLIVLVLLASACFGAYNAAKPADNEYVADVPALVRENFRAIKDDAIVNAGTVAGLSVGNASGNIPRSNGTLNTNLNSDLLDGYHASAFNASDALLLRLDGSRAMTGPLKFSGNYAVLRDTAVGSDNGYVGIYGGGALGYSRAAGVAAYGINHATLPGILHLDAGNTPTGDIIMRTGAGMERFRIGYAGTSTFSGNVILSGNRTIHTGTSDTADNSYILVTGGGAGRYSAGGGWMQFTGNEFTSNGGILALGCGQSSRIAFYGDSDAEMARMTSAGRWLIGTTTDDGTNKLQVNGSVAFSNGIYLPNNIPLYGKSSGGTSYSLAHVDASNIVNYGVPNLETKLRSNGTLTHNGYTVWTSASDGSGSGLDADTLDGSSSAAFATAAQGTKADNALPSSSYTAADVLTKIKTVDGSGSGLDADTLDGYSINSTGADAANTVVLRNASGTVTCVVAGTSYAVIGYNNNGSGAGVYGRALDGAGVMGRCDSAGGYDFYAAGSGTDYGTSSSIRWKKNRKPIANALGIVEKLEGLRFTWDKEHGGNPGIGFIAEEVGKYLPEIVVWDAKAPGYADGMDYSKMTPLLLQAIKELHAKVQRRTSDNAALLRKIEKQEREINELREEMRVMRSLFEAAVGGKADYDRMDGKHAGEYIQTN